MPTTIVERKSEESPPNGCPACYFYPQWEEHILNLLDESQKQQRLLINEILEEIKNTYTQQMQNFDPRIALVESQMTPDITINEIMSRNIKPENPNFSKNRRFFQKTYFLSHKLIRNIIKISSLYLPSILIDMKNYSSSQTLTLDEISQNIKRDVRRASLKIFKLFYLKTVQSMLKIPELKTMPNRRLTSLLRCATLVMSQLILNAMTHTIHHLIKTLQLARNYPRVKLDLVYEEGRIVLKPRLNQMFEAFQAIIDDVAGIAQDLVPLEYWMGLDVEGHIKVALPDWFLEDSHSRLQVTLESTFQTLKDHRETINSQFSNIDMTTTWHLSDGELEPEEFRAMCSQVETLMEFFRRAKSLVNHVHFDVSPLCQEEASESLQRSISDRVEALLEILVSKHRSFAESINSEFEALQARAANIPEETQPLFELCDYLSYSSKVLVPELERKICRSMDMLVALLQVATLTKEHMELNRTIVKKLWNVDQVFQQSNNACESMKSILEDDLQRRIGLLNDKVDLIIPELVILDDMDDVTRVEEYVEFLVLLVRKVMKVEEEIRGTNLEEKLFKFPETAFPKIVEIRELLLPFSSLVRLICDWRRDHAVWMNGPFYNLNAEKIDRKTSHYHQQLSQIYANFKVKIKTEMVLSKVFKFAGMVDDPDPMQHPAPLKLCWQALRDIGTFQKNVPLAICMCNKSLAQRHWDEMSKIAGFDLTPNARTTLGTMVEMNLFKDLQKYEIISVSASKELALHEDLMGMIEEWNGVSFEIRDAEGTKAFSFVWYEEIDALLQDHVTRTEEMKCSNFVYPVKDEVEKFSGSLENLRYCLEQLPILFHKIDEFGSLFNHGLVITDLEVGCELHRRINYMLEEIRTDIVRRSTFQKLFGNTELIESMEKADRFLVELNDIVKKYLEKLRYVFPRFFFLNDEDIIAVLDLDNDTNFRNSFKKCFCDLRLQLDNDSNIIFARGKFGEKIRLRNVVKTIDETKSSEIRWLMLFEEELLMTIKENLAQTYYSLQNTTIDNTFDFLHIIKNTPGMIIICVWVILWTSEIQNLITCSNPLQECLSYYNKKTELKNYLINKLNTEINNKSRIVLTTLIIRLIEEEQLLRHFIDEKESVDKDFLLETQMAYYLTNGNVQVSVLNTAINYRYEYYSLQKPGIIMTPLTEKCYHSLIIAYKNNVSSSIVGPANSGKIETLKGLTQALATLLCILDCKEEFHYSLIQRIFTGFITSGPWLCFKNFCCLKPEFFSIIGQYVSQINSSKMSKLNAVNIYGRYLKLNASGFFCTTMNPNCVENLHILDETRRNFRTIAIIDPDEERIIEVHLSSSGFLNAKQLAVVIKTVLSYFKAQQANNASKHKFNLRSVMKIIEVATNQKVLYPKMDEQALLIRALINVCLPKLEENEITVFRHLIQDMVPNITIPSPNYFHLLERAERVCESKSIYFVESMKLKVIQLFEAVHSHQTLIITGEPLAGKSLLIRLLAEVLTSSFTSDAESKFDCQIKLHWLNQNAITLDRLHDFLANPKWIDTSDAKSWNWFVLDGNLSDNRHELLQALLNHNSLPILPFSEKLSNLNRLTIMFEVADIRHASPSFVARCGVVHLEDVDHMTYVKSDIKKTYPKYEDFVSTLFEWSTNSCLKYSRRMCSNILQMPDNHLITSTWKLFKMFLDHAFLSNDTEKDVKKDFVISWCQAAIVMSTVWGLGGFLEEQSQVLFDTFCLSLWLGTNEEFPYPKGIKPFENLTLNETQLREYFYVFKGGGSWKFCGDALKGETIIEDPLRFRDSFVPTVDTVRYTTVLQYHLQNRQPFILCSDSPSGKSAYLKYFLERKTEGVDCNANYYHVVRGMSLKSTVSYILSKMEKIRFNRYKGKGGLCVNLIDDLNCAVDEDTAAPLLELIRQHFEHGYWCDVDRLDQIYLQDTMFCGALSRPNVRICQRFLRHFHVYAVHPPSKNNMFRIFTNVLFSELKRNMFAADVLTNVNSIVNAVLAVYASVLSTLKPVPSKFQYLFDLRDVSRLIACCGLIKKESVENKVTFARLWVHETFRVFGDRIVDDVDKNWLFVKMKEAVKTYFKDTFESAFDHLPKGSDNELNTNSLRQLFFGNFMDNGKESGDIKKYEEINSLAVLKNRILQYTTEHNESNEQKIDVTLTNHFLENVVKVCRVLSVPGGSLLMISSHGSGRRSVSLLASYLEKHQFVEMSVSSTIDAPHWKRNLKDILITCGSSEKNVTFLCKDLQLIDEYLQDISGLIKYGEIPQLFSNVEWQTIIQKVRLLAQNGDRNMEIPTVNVKEYFARHCKDQLHFILCLNRHKQRKLRTFLRNHANLASCCFIDWWEDWPREALQQVACSHLKDIKISEDSKNPTLQAFTHFYFYLKNKSQLEHLHFPGNYIPVPTTCISMAKSFVDIFAQTQQTTTTSRNNYVNGLKKLESAAHRVQEMKTKLSELRLQLEASSQETEATMGEIEKDNASIASATVLVKSDEEVANKKAMIASILKTECEADLAIAIPILEDAVAALNTLKPTDITLVKAMKNPPDTVKLVMAAVCVMLEVPPDRVVESGTGKKVMDYWGPSKRILGDMNFLQILKDYDKDNISPMVMQTIQKTYMTDASFQPRIVAKASSAAEGLCKWVRAMVSYDKVAKTVAPKKEKLAIANNECELAESYLNEKRRALAHLNDKLDVLKNTLKMALAKKDLLESEVISCSNKLEKAEDLVASLINEKERWIETAEELQRCSDSIIGDMTLISGIVTYLGPFSSGQRSYIAGEWHREIQRLKLPCSKTYNVVDMLGWRTMADEWHHDGLPLDAFSLENAVIVKSSRKWAFLLLDAEAIGSRWIKNMEVKQNGLACLRNGDPNLMDVIQRNMEEGTPVLIENVDADDMSDLMCIVSQPMYMDQESLFVNFGEKMVRYNPTFRLFIVSNYRDPPASIEVYDKMTVINFALTSEALEDMFLNILVAREKPEFSDKFKDIETESVNNKQIIRDEEHMILQILCESEDIIEDGRAIGQLVESKDLLQKTMKDEKLYDQMKVEMSNICDNYKPFTSLASRLYNTTKMLGNLNIMYRFSIAQFIGLYKRSLETSNRSPNFAKLLQYFKLSLLRTIYTSVHRSLFERDKLIYSFLTATDIQLDANQIPREEMDLFMTLGLEVTTAAEYLNPGDPWLPECSWQQLCFVSKIIDEFQPIITSFTNDPSSWSAFYESCNFDQKAPLSWTHLSSFHQLILTRILRPDRVISALQKFIDESINHFPDLDLKLIVANSYSESTCLTPIMFLLPSYSSPLSAVLNQARIIGCSSEITNIYLGREQTQEDAELSIESARKNGSWIFVHNLHLSSPSWLNKLDKICDDLDPSDTSLEFRLWLSTAVTHKIPASCVQRCIKIAQDHPTNLKQCLSRSYTPELSTINDLPLLKLYHSYILFHAVVCSRRGFASRSWNIDYEFAEPDLRISIDSLRDLISVDKASPRKTLNYVIGECIYGGKLLDRLDKDTLDVVLASYCKLAVANEPIINAYSPRRVEGQRDWIEFVDRHLPLQKPCDALEYDRTAEMVRNERDLKAVEDRLFRMKSHDQCCQFGNPTSRFCILYTSQPPRSPRLFYTDLKTDLEDPNLQGFVRTTIIMILENLTTTFDLDLIKTKYPPNYMEPLNNVLFEEAQRYNSITGIILSSLRELEDFYAGRGQKTEYLDELERLMYYGLVPVAWKMNGPMRFSERSLPVFIAELCDRVRFVRKWVDEGHPREMLLRALTVPAALFAAIKLGFARKNGVGVDRVTIDWRVVDDSAGGSEGEEFLLSELYLCGARWEKGLMRENVSKTFYCEMPGVGFRVGLEVGVGLGRKYDCPLYVTALARRKKFADLRDFSNYVCKVELDSEEDAAYWVKMGVALYCDVA